MLSSIWVALHGPVIGRATLSKNSLIVEPLAKLKTTKYPSNLLAYFQRNFEIATAKPLVLLS
jgi:hypothetical protein